jgi:hypothetical protein
MIADVRQWAVDFFFNARMMELKLLELASCDGVRQVCKLHCRCSIVQELGAGGEPALSPADQHVER